MKPKPEYEMVNPIRTNILVSDWSSFRVFLDANDMSCIELGYYVVNVELSWTKHYFENRICYSNVNPTEVIEQNLIYMNIKYGSLENAFIEYKKELKRIFK